MIFKISFQPKPFCDSCGCVLALQVCPVQPSKWPLKLKLNFVQVLRETKSKSTEHLQNSLVTQQNKQYADLINSLALSVVAYPVVVHGQHTKKSWLFGI